MHKTAVINVVGLTSKLLARLPSIQRLGRAITIGHILPAVTCSVQATYLTGTTPSEHGIVGNGWYFRDECEVRFWHQSDKLVQQPRVWDLAKQRDPSFTCANLFWWNAMYSSADVTVTPRPVYTADGRKLPDVWTNPPQFRHELQRKLGQFPLFKFWGPASSIESSQWIARAAIEVGEQFDPTLMLIYLPHLDYALQRRGPDDPGNLKDLADLDGVMSDLLNRLKERRIIVLSEYGIARVDRPVHLNRVLRERGWLATIDDQQGRELLDAGSSSAFAIADHQVAHVYLNEPNKLEAVAQAMRSTPGVAEVLNRSAQREAGLDHPRSGEIIAVAEPGAWFTYYYWLDDSRAPDFARTVDIHRKPGYDPVELFIDPKLPAARQRIAWKLLRRHMGFRTLLDVIPLDATLVRGSHGRRPASLEDGPVLISTEPRLLNSDRLLATQIRDLILQHLLAD
ncbi:MAG TPA: alkaline phosphatase family protein [Tepidisphaeraceae bacterium]